ncbi:MAG: tetratricopeptide repeat protein [Treponema sp.]|jgi:tetratricopeptide (TPR) repeat protein|nr:tetratricopeptide repeat protein [Treponema sp.]
MKHIVLSLLVFLPVPALFSFPDYYVTLRDAIYAQQLNADEIVPLYQEAMEKARENLTGSELYIILSRCEYMLGRAYQYENRKPEAAARYEQGILWAQKAQGEGAGAESWQMLAENISQSCAVRSVSYALANGLKVESYSKKALAEDPQNAAARFMIAARWVYAPSPFHDYKKGIRMMEEILSAAGNPGKDDLFNIYSAIGYAYLQQKKHGDARPWFLKALEIYPTNKYVLSLLNG